MVKMKMKFFKPNDGIYKVKMHLDKEDSSRIRDILKEAPEFKKICNIKGETLEYKSETVLPLDDVSSKGKQKILMVFGNPAINSVDKGMFYFSKKPKEDPGGDRNKFAKHQMWSKLEKAGLIRNVNVNNEDSFKAREMEAEERKRLILKGNTLNKYLVGLTTLAYLVIFETGHFLVVSYPEIAPRLGCRDHCKFPQMFHLKLF